MKSMWCSGNVIVSIITIIIIISVTLGAKETYCVLSCMVTIWLSVSKVRLACVICVRHVLPVVQYARCMSLVVKLAFHV